MNHLTLWFCLLSDRMCGRKKQLTPHKHARACTHTHTHTNTFRSALVQQGSRSWSLLPVASCLICEPDQSHQFTFLHSAAAARDRKAELFISCLAHTHTHTHTLSESFLGDTMVYRTFPGMCRLDLGRSWPGFTGEGKRPYVTEWKKLIMGDRQCILALPKGVGPKTLKVRSLLLSEREIFAQTRLFFAFPSIFASTFNYIYVDRKEEDQFILMFIWFHSTHMMWEQMINAAELLMVSPALSTIVILQNMRGYVDAWESKSKQLQHWDSAGRRLQFVFFSLKGTKKKFN